MLENLKYTITGIPVIDNIFTIVIKIIFIVILIMVAMRCMKHYHEGQTGQMIIAGVTGVILMAAIIGFSNIADAANSLSNAFDFSASTSGSKSK